MLLVVNIGFHNATLETGKNEYAIGPFVESHCKAGFWPTVFWFFVVYIYYSEEGQQARHWILHPLPPVPPR